MKKHFKLVSFILFPLSTAMLIGACFAFNSTRNFISSAESTEGKVVEMVERNGDNGVTFAPVFTFLNNTGKEFKVYSSTSSYPPAYEVNEIVPVLYQVNNPKGAKINAWFSLWGLTSVLAILGMFQLFFGTTFYILHRRQATANKAIE